MAVYNTAGMGTYGSTWQHREYSGAGNVAPLIGTLAGRVVIIAGNADGVFYELELALKHYPTAVIFAVNDVGMFIEHIDHWVSLHYKSLLAWRNVRWTKGYTSDVQYHSTEPDEPVEWVWAGLGPSVMALSGYFAAQVAYIMGADYIILAGCPGAAKRRFFESRPAPNAMHDSDGVREQFINETKRVPDFKKRLRSMSGWTMAYLGGI